jgi:hypothetical protein
VTSLSARAVVWAASRIALGDLPTWIGAVATLLGVGAASVAAYFVYQQLKAQREELADQRADITRQTAALERQQADQIDLAWASGRAVLFSRSGSSQNAPVKREILVVHNASNRPIRMITCQGQHADGSPMLPTESGSCIKGVPGERAPYVYQVFNPQPAHWVRLLRAGEMWAFIFETGEVSLKDLRYEIEFTDDAELCWQLDQDLHLRKPESTRLRLGKIA